MNLDTIVDNWRMIAAIAVGLYAAWTNRAAIPGLKQWWNKKDPIEQFDDTLRLVDELAASLESLDEPSRAAYAKSEIKAKCLGCTQECHVTE